MAKRKIVSRNKVGRNKVGRNIANRNSQKKVIPMGDVKSPLPFNCEFTAEEYERLSCGLIPEGMDDKWFIFIESDWLYFHRSWTGTCIYQLRFKRKNDIYLAAESWVQRDSDKYRETDLAYDAAVLSFLIDNCLLGKQTPFPLPNNLPADYPEGAFQHIISGSAFPETPIDKVS